MLHDIALYEFLADIEHHIWKQKYCNAIDIRECHNDVDLEVVSLCPLSRYDTITSSRRRGSCWEVSTHSASVDGWLARTLQVPQIAGVGPT